LILVDTSVWIAHLWQPVRTLDQLLGDRQILMHPLVVGELAMGNLPRRLEILSYFDDLPKAVVASDREVRILIETERLFGLGVGYPDAHLLAAARLTPGATLWTIDQRLADAAGRLGLSPT
jgi:predicted nucleic acid-binding protein